MEFRKLQIRGRTWLMAVAVGGALLTGSQAQATILAPGSGAVTTPGTASLAGLTQVATESTTFQGKDVFTNVVFSGTLISRVYSDPSNALGGLDFAYQVIADLGQPDYIHTITVANYPGFQTDLDYVTGSGGTTYATANRGSPGNGNTISLSYLANSAGGIAPGVTTDWILVKTNATQYDNSGVTNLIDGGGAAVVSYEPAPGGSGTPEPASLGLLGLGGLALLRRRR